MEIKNLNTGTIHANNANIGDTYNVTNVIEGLAFLLSDYQAQIKNINRLILEFKPITALDLLIDLEKRITETNIPNDNKISSKILFLKALCKRELENFSKEESALDFIKAYNLNKEDEELKTRACIEYLNISDRKNAIDLADNILNLDNYNLTAWFVKSVTSDDIKSFLQSLPKVVFNNYNFQQNIIFNLLGGKLKRFNDLNNYGLQLSFDFEKYKVVTFENKQGWIITLDLLVTSIINKTAIKYISGENFIIENDPEIIEAISLLDVYTKSLESTEISYTSKHQKFYLNYLKYLNSNDDMSFNSLGELYKELGKPQWIYTRFYCQLANHKKEFQLSLDCLVEYEKLKGELHSEFYLFKSVVLHFLSRHDEVNSLYDNYLKSLDVIDENHLFNLINAFFNIQQHFDDKSKFIFQLEKVLDRKFAFDDLKVLLKVTVELIYIRKYDREEILASLNSIKNNNLFDNNCKNLIAENLNQLGKPLESLNFMDTYIDKTIVSESLKLYIFFLHNLLQSKEDTPKGKGNELIKLLKFWREKSSYIDEDLLRIEHDLFEKINDLDNLEEIDYLLYSNFPENLNYLYFYLAVLEKKSNFDKIKKLSIVIPNIYEEERIGIAISGILLRNKNNTKKGFEILYNLAIDYNNTEARQNYFGGSLLFKEHFKNYDSVELGHWVIHNVDGKKEKRKILKSEGIQKDFLGKKIGEKFTNVNTLMNKESTIEIIEIFNDALNLYRDITIEAENPINELGFRSLEIPADINDFSKFLVEQFGTNGTEEKIIADKGLDDYYNYRIGFLSVVSAVFKSKFVDAYLHLTSSKNARFTTIPNIITGDIDKENHKVQFALDFSSLMLFYYLEKELKFKFKHKFIVSKNKKFQIENEVSVITNSPESTLSVNITSEGIVNHIYPEGINNKRIDFLKSIIDWIEINCDIDLVAEKLDVVLKLTKNEGKLERSIMNNLIDSLHLSIRENHRLISSDVSAYLLKANKINNNYLNPEKYLLTYYPEKCNSEFYRFLLKANYLGIDINLETLKNEFSDLLANKENYYELCLENLQFSINGNSDITIMLSKFLKELYLLQTLTIESKNNYASKIISNAIYGMPNETILKFSENIFLEFKLFVNFYDEVINIFLTVINPRNSN
ncbi:PIN domain-containing protein [Flavobacterium psychrolimnae]|nr:hypothetical protein [Flavobacterium psychrolimnae]